MESDELRFRRVGLSNDGAVIFCEMDNGRTYAMPLGALDRADDWDPRAKPKTVRIIHDGFAAIVNFHSGLEIDFPADYVVSVCEPTASRTNGRRTTSGIGRRIREIRGYRGLTLDALAAKCGIAKPNLSRLEHDKVSPQFETVRAVAAALDVHPALLVRKDAWTWTRHQFDEWRRALEFEVGRSRSGGVPTRAAELVEVFLARWPEHRYARPQLLEHADLSRHLSKRDPELRPYLLDAGKWAKEKTAADGLEPRLARSPKNHALANKR